MSYKFYKMKAIAQTVENHDIRLTVAAKTEEEYLWALQYLHDVSPNNIIELVQAWRHQQARIRGLERAIRLAIPWLRYYHHDEKPRHYKALDRILRKGRKK